MNELIINVTLGETRVARLENGDVSEIFVERHHHAGITGNIYKGRVVRVLPGMEAAFVDIGLERTAFLHISDVTTDDIKIGGEDHNIEHHELSQKFKYKGAKIEDVVKEGREILVQVAKEPIGTKGARITSYISLPGRYIVYMPTVDHLGVSRRIESDKERARLKKLIEEHKEKGEGFIVRTASEGVTEAELSDDITYLRNLWKAIEVKGQKAKPSSLVHAELDVVLRTVRDFFTSDINKLVIDSKREFERVKEFIREFLPSAKESAVQLYSGDSPIFDAHGIEVEITRAIGEKVWLKSGGYIIIEQTEALTAIDVNTGRFVGKHNLEDTILKTNLEAVKEIVYQIKLRNIGGIIILDFIDMEKKTDRQKVYSALKEALKNDRARSTITKISELGLVEMTRKRIREDIRACLTSACPYCEGKGYLKSPATISYDIFREIMRDAPKLSGKQMEVLAHPSVANFLNDEERASIEQLEKVFNVRITVKSADDHHLEQFDVVDK